MFRRRKRTKKRVHEYRGVLMRSKPETVFAAHLDTIGASWCYEPEKFDYLRAGRYTPDFEVERADGSVFYVEYKGWLQAEDRSKMIAIKDQYPGYDFRFVFQNASKTLNPKSKTTYGEWATKHGFKWAEKEIPKEWLEVINERV